MKESVLAGIAALFNEQKKRGVSSQEFIPLMKSYGAPILQPDGEPVPVGNWETHLEPHEMCTVVKNGFDPEPLDLAVCIHQNFSYDANHVLAGVKNCCEGLTDAELDAIADQIGAEHTKETLAICNKDGRYLGFKVNNSPEIWGSATRIGSYEKLILVLNDDGTVSIKNKDGHYFGFKNDNNPSIWGSSNRIGGYEKFNLIDNNDGTKTLQNKDGNYFGFKHDNNPAMWASANRIGGYEKLTIKKL